MVYKGSKAALRRWVVPIIENLIISKRPIEYIEPFVGGANIITEVKHGKKTGSDINKELIDFLNLVKEDPSLSFCPPECPKEFYDDVRKDYRSGGKKYCRSMHLAVGWLASYGGRFYDGGYGGKRYNGHKKTRYRELFNNMLQHATRFKGINFECKSFLEYSPNIYERCLFYCDPPYKDTSGYCVNFPFDEFRQWCRDMGKKNWVLISEYDMPDDFEVVSKRNKKVLIDSRKDRCFEAVEKLYYTGRDGAYEDTFLIH